MYALLLRRYAHGCASHTTSCLSRAPVRVGKTAARRGNSTASSPGSSSSNSMTDWQSEMDASLFKLVARARDKLYFAAGQVALDQPFTLFFSKYQKQQGTQVLRKIHTCSSLTNSDSNGSFGCHEGCLVINMCGRGQLTYTPYTSLAVSAAPGFQQPNVVLRIDKHCFTDFAVPTLQADDAAAPAQLAAGQASLVTFPLDLQSSSRNSSGSSGSCVNGLIAAAKPLLQTLLDAAAPSSFGRGKESVYDPSFRSALELPASHMALNIPHPPADVLQQIQTLLQPDSRAIVADFYKLNIYGSGGFFKPHFDTPRSSDMFGSLVVCLPSPHSGGGLVLRHNSDESGAGISHCFDWSTKQQTGSAPTVADLGKGNSQQAQLRSLHWAAFYSDSEHEVLPVTDGYRITLTYNLRAVGEGSTNGVTNSATAAGADSGAITEDAGEVEEPTDASASPAAAATSAQCAAAAKAAAAAVPPAASGVPGDTTWLTATDVGSSAALVDHIKALLADKKWHPEGDTLGFVLTHRYARDLASLAGLPFPAALKGPDRLLWVALLQAGLQPEVLPMFCSWNGPAEHDDTDWYRKTDSRGRSSWEEDNDNEASDDEGAPEPPVLQPVHVAPPPADEMDPELLREEFPKRQFRWELKLGTWGGVMGDRDGLGEVCDQNLQDEDFSSTLQLVYDTTPADGVNWITPVKADDFQYADRFLAGGNEPYEMAFYASAVLLVKVPAWSERQP